jgi:hypothetical protein
MWRNVEGMVELAVVVWRFVQARSSRELIDSPMPWHLRQGGGMMHVLVVWTCMLQSIRIGAGIIAADAFPEKKRREAERSGSRSPAARDDPHRCGSWECRSQHAVGIFLALSHSKQRKENEEMPSLDWLKKETHSSHVSHVCTVTSAESCDRKMVPSNTPQLARISAPRCRSRSRSEYRILHLLPASSYMAALARKRPKCRVKTWTRRVAGGWKGLPGNGEPWQTTIKP